MLSIKAYAKINLYLDVISKYPNGYHQIESIMQSVSLHDLIEISPARDISLSCSREELCGGNNLAFRAADLLRKKMNPKIGAFVNITKRIPVAAGLAGGSADAAATLTGLNELWGLNLSLEDLQEIGLELGADVPFCLAGGTMLAEGVGERLTRLKPMPDTEIVLVTPPVQVSTAQIYNSFDEDGLAPIGLKHEFIDALSSGNMHKITELLNNALETVALKRYPAILGIKQLAVERGGIGALMSGSGPTVFVICRDKSAAESTADMIKSQEKTFFVEIVKPVNRGVEIVPKI